MNNTKFCCLRPNFCTPSEIKDLSKLPTGYVYAVDVVYRPEILKQYSDILLQLPQLIDLNTYKWITMHKLQHVKSSNDCTVIVYVRPRGVRETGKIHTAYFTPEFRGDINTCTFCLNDVCLRHANDDVPTFCNEKYYDFGNPYIFWGLPNRKVFDTWLPEYDGAIEGLQAYVKSLTRHQRAALVADKSVPIEALIVSGVLCKEDFKTGGDRS